MIMNNNNNNKNNTNFSFLDRKKRACIGKKTLHLLPDQL